MPGKQASGLFSAKNGPAGPGSPSMINPQQRYVRCGAVSTRKTVQWTVFTEQRAGRPWDNFSEQRAGRPRAGIFAEQEQNSFIAPLSPGVRRARTTVRWTVFSENRPAGPGFPQGREAKARGFPAWGSEGPENRPVACFQRRTGRQALEAPPF